VELPHDRWQSDCIHGQKWAIRDEGERLISLLSSMTILVWYLTPSSISPEYVASYLRALAEALLTKPGDCPGKSTPTMEEPFVSSRSKNRVDRFEGPGLWLISSRKSGMQTPLERFAFVLN
jgi:hypothetical protein